MSWRTLPVPCDYRIRARARTSKHPVLVGHLESSATRAASPARTPRSASPADRPDADGRLLVGVMMDEDALDDARAELNAALATREQL